MTDNIYKKYVDAILEKSPFSERMLKKIRPVKVTWKDRMKWKLNDYKQRVVTACEVLRGKHECGEY